MDRQQYARQFEENYRHTTHFLLSKGIPEEEARAVAQAAWAKGWERRNQLRDPGKAAVWVNSIAFNCYCSRYRKQSRHQDFEDLPVTPDVNLAAIDVYRMLDKCRQAEQDILRRRYLEEEPIRELAQDLGCSETAIRLRLMRARRSLRAAFEEFRESTQ